MRAMPEIVQDDVTAPAGAERRLVRDGFVTMLPLWTGAIPAGIAYAVAAHQAGLSSIETQVMSLTVFSAAAQLGATAVLDDGVSLVGLALIAVALNVQLLLLGLVAGRANALPRRARALVSFFLTDAAFGVAARDGRVRWQVLLGAGISMYIGWNLGTLVGTIAGPATSRFDHRVLALVAPLAFVAVLAPLVRSSAAFVTLLIAGSAAVGLAAILPVGPAILGAALTGSAAGSWWADRAGPGEARP